MIGFLRGTVLEKAPERLLVDVHGVGYELRVPLSTFYQVGEPGAPVALHVHTHVREDALQLFGFLTVLEQQVLRCPAGGGAGASSVVQGVQEGVLQERVVTGELVPSLRINRIKGCCY